jgi:hypothetical protein
MIDITNINLYNYTRKFELIYVSSGIKIWNSQNLFDIGFLKRWEETFVAMVGDLNLHSRTGSKTMTH